MNKSNYIVHINGTGINHNCDTVEEVWETIDKQGWSGYEVRRIP